MAKSVSKGERDVLDAIAALGGVDVGTVAINRYLGSGPYTPLFYALRNGAAKGLVQARRTGPGRDGVPIAAWSLTAAGRRLVHDRFTRKPRPAARLLLKIRTLLN